MQYSDEEIIQFKNEFARKRQKQIFLALPIFIFLIITVFFPSYFKSLGLTQNTLKWGLMYYAVFAVGLSLLNWRCPACGKYLGRSFWIKFCSKCGVPLS
jgi:ribosomal protein S27AE